MDALDEDTTLDDISGWLARIFLVLLAIAALLLVRLFV